MATEVIPHESMYEALRRWPRYKLEVPLRIVAHKGGKTAIVQGRGNELNEGGMAIFAGIELALTEEIAVEFTPPYSGDPIRVRAIVRNRKGYSYGVEFLTRTIDDHQNVDQIRTVLRGLGSPIR
ncbi:MAG TPA: PilZ domain-containing protein [Terriglobales bacterium]|nr:PilZ domain-containing protein [Terriglobales bacterium]